MQYILYFTRQPGSRAFSSTSFFTFSLLNSQSIHYLTPLVPYRVYRLTASSPLLINNNTKLSN